MPPTDEVPGSRNGGRHSWKSHQSATEVWDLTDSDSPSDASTIKLPSPATSPSSSGSKLRLSLNRFGFTNPFASVPSVTTQKEPAPPDEKPKRSRRQRPLLPAIGVSPAALSPLARCVCCETRWTVKKTAAQKLSHMDACSKKRSYSLETMSFLIKRELNAVEKAAVDGAEMNTRLQSILQNVRSNKRQKNNGPTVQQYTSQTRETILKRARMILGPAMNLEESDAFLDLPVSTQAAVPCHSMDPIGVVALDVPFRPSTLRYQSCEGSHLKVSRSFDQLQSIGDYLPPVGHCQPLIL